MLNKNRVKRLHLSTLLALLLVCALVLSGCLPILVFDLIEKESVEDDFVRHDTVEPYNDSNDDDGRNYQNVNNYNGLADNRNTAVSYEIKDEVYAYSTAENVETLGGIECELEFHVEYVQLFGLDPSIEKVVNEKIYRLAMNSVYTYYLEPTDGVKRFLTGDEGADPANTHCWIESTVECYVEYNDDSIISLAFDDHYFAGSIYAEYGDLRSFVIDLSTGESYKLSNEIIEINQDFADLWYQKALAIEEDSFFLEVQPKEDFVFILANTEGYINRYFCSIFIDNSGDIRISLTYHMGNDVGIARGWIDVPFTTEELKPYRIESGFWRLYDALGTAPMEADA